MLRIGIKQELINYTFITVVAIGFAFVLFKQGGQGLYFDAWGYYELGRGMAEAGFLSFSSDVRTYGYPLFVAICWLLTDHSTSMARFVIFITQLTIFLSVCVFAAQRIRSLRNPAFAILFFACTALNPLLLIYTTVVLTDLLSAVLVFLSILLSVELPSLPRQSAPSASKSFSQERAFGISFLTFLLAGFSVMIRPANLPIALVVLLIWLAKAGVGRTLPVRVFLCALLGFAIPFIPQLVFNWRDYQQIQPLIARELYSYQMQVGIKVLKYGTLAIPGQAASIPYLNPFLPADISSPLEFASQQPLGFALTLGSHLFAFFDQDFAFPYIVDLSPWYRWPLSLANYTFLFFAFSGIIVWTKRFIKSKRFDSQSLFFGGMILACLGYLVLYLFTAVENRFSLPEYLLASPFFVLGLSCAAEWFTDRRWKNLAVLASALGIFLILAINLSVWLQYQAAGNVLNRSEAFDASSSYTTNSLNVRWGEQVQLLNFSLKSPQSFQGGDLIFLTLQWKCNGASTDSYDIQVNLEDEQAHVWAHALRFGDAPVSPCPSRFWEPSLEDGDLLTIKLSPGIPAGMYKINVTLSNRQDGNVQPVYNSSGEQMGDKVTLTALVISKNKSSFEARQLKIEQPLYVDMGEIRFLGYIPFPQSASPGETINVRVYWRARGKPKGDYVVAIQIRSEEGATVVEQSSQPALGKYPTSRWAVGEVLLDWHDLQVPADLVKGTYQIFVELRDASTQKVLGEVALGQIEIE